MRRSRSPRQPAPSLRQDWVLARDLHQSFDRIRGESRGGRHWKRRFRSCCLRLLEHLQYLIQLLVHQTWPRTSRSVLRRAGQIQGRLDQIRGGYTPERNQPLLERLDQESSEAEDSEVAETVVLTSDSEVEDPEPISVGGIWRGRFAAVRVTQSNPLIRSRSSASSANPRPAPVPPSEPVNLPRGVEIRPAISHKLQSQYVLALDWHQCLDVCRTWNGTLRPTGYHILDIFQEKIAALREIFPDLCVIILSYCHAPEFRNGVLSVPDDCIDFRVVTDKKIGPLGKLAALKAIFKESTGIAAVDDNDEVLSEYLAHRNLPAAQRFLNVQPFGIQVPNRGRRNPQVRVQGVPYWKNVAEVLDKLITGI